MYFHVQKLKKVCVVLPEKTLKKFQPFLQEADQKPAEKNPETNIAERVANEAIHSYARLSVSHASEWSVALSLYVYALNPLGMTGLCSL